MWTLASTTLVITQALSDTGTILAQVIGSVVVALIALQGLGFALKHIRRYITGKKF